MKKYIFMLWVCLVLGMAACNDIVDEVHVSSTDTEEAISPTVFQQVLVDEKISPTPNAILSMTETELKLFEETSKQNREMVKQALIAEPTVGPEPYSILEIQREIEIGDVVTMGTYTHSHHSEIDFSMRFPIEWIVVDVAENKALLLSRYSIDVKPFTSTDTFLETDSEEWSATWETSEVRKWLNEIFYYVAFNQDEERCVLPTENRTEDNTIYDVEGGGDTVDFVFLFSIEEAQSYFSSNEVRRTQIKPDVTMEDLLIHDGEFPRNTTDYYDWWLRSPGENGEKKAYVGRTGEIVTNGEWITNEEISVRPAMWIDLEKVKEIGLELEAE